MNKKIATLVSVLSLISFGAQARAPGKASAGAATGHVNAQGSAGGQGNFATPPALPGERPRGGPLAPNPSGQADANGQVNSAGVNGTVNAQDVNAQGSVNGQANAAGQGNFAAPPAPPGERPPGRPLSPNPSGEADANGQVTAPASAPPQSNFATPPAPPGGERPPPGRPLTPTGQTADPSPSAPGQAASNPNQSGLSPTSRDPRLQRMNAANGAAAASQDQAPTPFDRGMVNLLRQRLQSQNTAPATSAKLQFVSNGGDVTVMGSVPTAADKARIVSIIRSSPGVVRVTDQMTVAGSAVEVRAASQPPAPNSVTPRGQ